MTRERQRSPELQRLQRVEALCSFFEGEWLQDRPPDLARHLENARAEDRPALLKELLLVEWAYRAKKGDRPALEAERERFAGLGDVVEAAWRRWGELAPATQGGDGTPTGAGPCPGWWARSGARCCWAAPRASRSWIVCGRRRAG
jgi:hypothetical protein